MSKLSTNEREFSRAGQQNMVKCNNAEPPRAANSGGTAKTWMRGFHVVDTTPSVDASYRQLHPFRIKQAVSLYRARKHGVYIDPSISLASIYRRDRGICQLCFQRIKGKSELSFDHLVPMCYGGPHVTANLVTAHTSCNVKKNRTFGLDPDLLRQIAKEIERKAIDKTLQGFDVQPLLKASKSLRLLSTAMPSCG